MALGDYTVHPAVEVAIQATSNDNDTETDMSNNKNPLDLAVPRNKTALMQHLQLLVGREGYRYWCGGLISPEKLAGFVEKMGHRYPITRNTRERSYHRKLGKAVVHLVVFPVDGKVQWWLLSDAVVGGLADPLTEDARVATDAMSADGHITFGDYVLLYASKHEFRKIKDAASGNPKGFYKDRSTWTWKLRGEVVRELRASIEECCHNLQLGDEGTQFRPGRGLAGLLATLRRRPLFSGIRNQVRDLHIEANELWRRRQGTLGRAHQMTDMSNAGNGASLTVAGKSFPTMSRIQVFGQPPTTIRSLTERRISSAAPLLAGKDLTAEVQN